MKVPEPRKLSSGNWFIQLRLNGESVPVTASTEKECRDAAALIKAEYKAGKRQIQKNKTNPTLRQAIDDYIECRSNSLSPSTIRGYRTIQNNRFQLVMDDKLKDITDWQKICNTEAKLCSAKTLKNAYRFITSVLTENGVAKQKVKLPQVIPNERPWLEPDQITKFVKAVEVDDCKVPALLALHSLRRSEICALTWDNVDLKNNRIIVKGAVVPNEQHQFVRNEANKNKTSARVVPIMIPELKMALKAEEDKTGTVIDCIPNTICNQINRVCTANDLPKVGVHGLRHSFASLAYHLGMPEKLAMKIGGWADSATMHKIYTHLAEMDVKKYENAMTDFYKNANQNANENKKARIINAYTV